MSSNGLATARSPANGAAAPCTRNENIRWPVPGGDTPILDIAPDDLAHAIKVAQKIAKAAVPVFAADGVTIVQFNEPASGQTVFHLHIHVIPRKDGVPLRPHGSFKEEQHVLVDQAAKLAAALKGA